MIFLMDCYIQPKLNIKFFRAGALAYLEELRDELVIKWVRMIQGEVLKRVRGRVFAKKRDQRLVHMKSQHLLMLTHLRELIKVAQRNFRKFMSMREWGWFIIIQKTRPLIGRWVKILQYLF